MMRLTTNLGKLWERLFSNKTAKTVLPATIGLLLSFGLMGPAHAQEKVPLSLKQAVVAGLDANQQIRLAQIDAQKAKYGLKKRSHTCIRRLGLLSNTLGTLNRQFSFYPCLVLIPLRRSCLMTSNYRQYRHHPKTRITAMSMSACRFLTRKYREM